MSLTLSTLKQLLLTLILAIVAMLWIWSLPAAAADLASGAQVFSNNCAACHAGGKNVVNAQKTLQQDVLEQYEMASLEAIKTQVTNGKNAMPAFKGRLSSTQIEDVAAYVLDQAQKGW